TAGEAHHLPSAGVVLVERPTRRRVSGTEDPPAAAGHLIERAAEGKRAGQTRRRADARGVRPGIAVKRVGARAVRNPSERAVRRTVLEAIASELRVRGERDRRTEAEREVRSERLRKRAGGDGREKRCPQECLQRCPPPSVYGL